MLYHPHGSSTRVEVDVNRNHRSEIFVLIIAATSFTACSPSPTPIAPINAERTETVVVTTTPSVAPATPPIAASNLPRTFVLDPKILAATKHKIAAGDKTLEPPFKKLVQDAESTLKFKPVSVMDKPQVADSGDKHDYLSLARYYWPDPTKPNGLPYISRDGQVSPELDTIPDKKNLDRVINATATLGLAYYFTGDEKYAQKSAEILRVWFLNPETRMNPNGDYAQVQKGHGVPGGSGIIDFVPLATIVDNVGLLDESKAWTTEDRRAMLKWTSAFLAWLTTSKPGLNEAKTTNNHGVWYDTQVIAYLLFAGKNEDAIKRLEAAKSERIAKQIEPNGEQPRELARTLSMHYSVYNLEAFFHLAELGERVGVDLWNYQTPDGRGIRGALDFLFPFLADEKQWAYPEIAPFDNNDAVPTLWRASTAFREKKYFDLALKLAKGDRKTWRLYLTLASLQ